jgi:hypothetical protein
LKSIICQIKDVNIVESPLVGEKNGCVIGKMCFTVVKDAVEQLKAEPLSA